MSEIILRSLKVVLATLIAAASFQIYMGHPSEIVYRYQPAKLAAMEARWETLPAGRPGD
ncbi:MAG: cytochrome ubiquinol oxidase subunit I [Leptolyngbya sp. Prado105]|jgi:cytochrome d ubiquinol oxidase subunit I|nr:cytochrome ubiquinol oxidase subunit I [Leptolyngbya sp. Prado105]